MDIVEEVMRRKRVEWAETTVLGFRYLFARHVSPCPNTGCWFWTLSDNGLDYGKMKHPELKKSYYAHRYAYEYLVGPIPDHLVIDHLCNMRCCVNPDHMELVTREENLNRRRDRFRQLGKCRKGHDLTGDNLYIDPKGNYVCRVCRNANAKRFRERRNNETPETVR